MNNTKGYAARDPRSPLAPFQFNRRDPRDNDVQIEILYCGVCHSDIHQARNEWDGSNYPMVPGHEIVGRVTKVGSRVSKFKVGELAGIGCFVDSCRTCSSCKEGLEQFCEGHLVWTYNGFEADLTTPTYGGYSTAIVADENYVLRIPSNLPLEGVAPLLCAGITTYSPLRHWKVGKGDSIGVIGLGGLGHMAVKLGAAMGAKVTVISHSPAKAKDAERLGAHEFLLSSDEAAVQRHHNAFSFIINTVSAEHDVNTYLNLLKRDGSMVLVGVPVRPLSVSSFSVIQGRRRLAGSLIGGIRETQEMLDFCSTHNITSDVEVIAMEKINEAYERTIRGDVRYRFVIDLNSLR